MRKVVNCGSLNIDYTYRVPHIVLPGETISCERRERHCGGKGAKQSIALARAGVNVKHVGRVGGDGVFLKDNLRNSGVDVEFVPFNESEITGSRIAISNERRNHERDHSSHTRYGHWR